MDSLLGFGDAGTFDDQSHDYKLVPWLNWDEWDSVRVALFSSSPDSVAFALRRISAWRSRGCLPVAVRATASIIEVQQKDPHFRLDMGDEGTESEELLAMLYSMAIMRIVNGVIEKTRKRREMSIADAAEAINLPRMLIDIRHEGSHRDLPSVPLLRLASTKALDWLKSYYWDPQMQAIPFEGGKSANIRKEIKSRLHELAASLKEKQNSNLSSPQDKRKRSKKQVVRVLKNLVRLYSLFSSEVVSVLLGLLLKSSNPVNVMDFPETWLANLSLDAMKKAFDDWKPAILEFSKKEPELILNLLTAVLDIAAQKDIGVECLSLSRYDAEVHKVELVSSLFSWLVEILVGMKHLHSEVPHEGRVSSCALPKATLIGLLRRCLLISGPGNYLISASASLLAQTIGSSSVIEKLNKLSALFSSFPFSADSTATTTECLDLVHQEKHINLAAEKLKFLELHRVKREGALNPGDDDMETGKRWITVESWKWKPCPIGMLPRVLGSSGHLPVLDNEELSSSKSMEGKYNGEVRKCSGKREASYDLDFAESNISSVKRMRGTLDAGDLNGMDVVGSIHELETIMDTSEAHEPSNVCDAASSDGIKGRLLLGGVLTKVGEEELQAIKSAIRILI
ncbi:hypothetical protein Dimus_021475 [Dionaea muscipula]